MSSRAAVSFWNCISSGQEFVGSLSQSHTMIKIMNHNKSLHFGLLVVLQMLAVWNFKYKGIPGVPVMFK